MAVMSKSLRVAAAVVAVASVSSAPQAEARGFRGALGFFYNSPLEKLENMTDLQIVELSEEKVTALKAGCSNKYMRSQKIKDCVAAVDKKIADAKENLDTFAGIEDLAAAGLIDILGEKTKDAEEPKDGKVTDESQSAEQTTEVSTTTPEGEQATVEATTPMDEQQIEEVTTPENEVNPYPQTTAEVTTLKNKQTTDQTITEPVVEPVADSNEQSSKKKKVAIAAISGLCVVLLGFFTLAFCCRKKESEKAAEAEADDESDSDAEEESEELLKTEV